jgi:hypothetical protein
VYLAPDRQIQLLTFMAYPQHFPIVE